MILDWNRENLLALGGETHSSCRKPESDSFFPVIKSTDCVIKIIKSRRLNCRVMINEYVCRMLLGYAEDKKSAGRLEGRMLLMADQVLRIWARLICFKIKYRGGLL